MALIIDPAKDEIRALKAVIDWRGKRVLEVGCGNGRLTLRLASLGPSKIEALEPDASLIHSARKNLPKHYSGKIHYQIGSTNQLKYPNDTFDVVVFSWVL
jgi:ubiquinone/menaquinone biosynthesis C-methylase UbiE